jgi:hypothetical protein
LSGPSAKSDQPVFHQLLNEVIAQGRRLTRLDIISTGNSIKSEDLNKKYPWLYISVSPY